MLQQQHQMLAIKVATAIIFLLAFRYWYVSREQHQEQYQSSSNSYAGGSKNFKRSVNTDGTALSEFNLNSALAPASLYQPVQCRLSRKILSVQTTLCMLRLEQDLDASYEIRNNGVSEINIMLYFVSLVSVHPDWLVLDIGSHVGQYALFAAKAGARVLAVEPNQDALLRMHKAAVHGDLQSDIRVFRNAVTGNRHSRIKRLNAWRTYRRRRRRLNFRDSPRQKRANRNKRSKRNNKFWVSTVTFNDLARVLPMQKSGYAHQRAVMRIDIDGFEPQAFRRAAQLFAAIDVRVVIMNDWKEVTRNRRNRRRRRKIRKMIMFLINKGLRPYPLNSVKQLKIKRWKKWPGVVIWKKSKND